jgi:hypothetical protein
MLELFTILQMIYIEEEKLCSVRQKLFALKLLHNLLNQGF